MFIRIIYSSSRWILTVVLFVLICMFQVYIFATQFNLMVISKQDNTLHEANVTIESLEYKQKWNELREWIYDLVSDQLNPIATRNLIDMLKAEVKNSSNDKHTPTMEYEKLRRRVRRNTQELWNYFVSEWNKIEKTVSVDKPNLIDEMKNVLELGAEHKRSLISDMDRMRMVDGYEQWRHDEAKSLGDLVQKRLHSLQNPSDCKYARKLVCKLNIGDCGFGCKLHHTIYCLMLAYSTERTLILKSKGRIYSNVSWEDVFQPVSETCLKDYSTKPGQRWPGQHDTRVLYYHISYNIITWPPVLPHSIPADLAPRLIRLYRDPGAWWVGQFQKYLLRPNDATQKMFENRLEMSGFKKPIVGVHIRRTDKLNKDASLHSVEEYMMHVEDYFIQLEMNGTNIKRRVFIASDDPSVIVEARQKYPSYEIIGDPDVAKLAALSTRFTNSSLHGIVSDMHMLSLCDYVVCTFSSNICRGAYEILHTKYPDASDRVKSLDEIYFYKKPIGHIIEAVLPHDPRNTGEIYIKPGDQIHITRNLWNGYSKGNNSRTNQTGIFPSFKVNERVEIVKLPTYVNVT